MMAKRFVQTGGYIMNSGAVAAANTQQLKLRTTCYHLTAPEEPEPWLIDSEMTRVYLVPSKRAATRWKWAKLGTYTLVKTCSR